MHTPDRLYEPEPPTPAQFEAARLKLIAALEAYLAGEISTLQVAPRVASLRSDLDQDDPDLLGFAGIDSETDVILVIDSLKGWHPSVREEKERQVADAEALHRPDGIEMAKALLARFARPA